MRTAGSGSQGSRAGASVAAPGADSPAAPAAVPVPAPPAALPADVMFRSTREAPMSQVGSSSKVRKPSSVGSTMVSTKRTPTAAARARDRDGSRIICRCAWVSATGPSTTGASTTRHFPCLRFW